MRRLFWLAAVAAALSVAGCADPGHYPGSRAKAGPGDPVLAIPVPPLPESLIYG